jgi:ATP-dependent Clp protease ATP-binding subunit ClpB
MNILLQILDDGVITDASGKKVNFENTVIVMTTNAGANGISATPGFNPTARTVEQSKTQKALESFLRPEFLNRIDEIITFRTLDEADFVKIAAIQLSDLRSALSERGIALTWTEDAAALLAKKSFSRKFGARNLRRVIQREVEDALASKLIADYNTGITAASISAIGDELVIACV